MFKTMREFLFDKTAVREPTGPLPVVTRTKSDFDQGPESGLRVTWLGHSTMLVEIDGKHLRHHLVELPILLLEIALAK